MSLYFKPYEGTRPYVFVSYAHRQSAEVVATIRQIHEKGYRLWYDEGIPAGSDWPANIAQHMQDCAGVLFFLSQRALESPNCFSEIRTAFRAGKPILVIWLENAQPDALWQEMLRNCRQVPLLPDAKQRADAILKTRFLGLKYRRTLGEKIPWRTLGLVFSLLFFLGAVTVFAAVYTGRWDPFPAAQPEADNTEATALPPSTEAHTEEPSEAGTEPPAEQPTLDINDYEQYFPLMFPDYLQERGIRAALGVADGPVYRVRMAEITALYYCGTMTVDDPDSITVDADGTWRVNGAPVITGPIADLSLLRYTVCLERLALIDQPLESLAEINGHVLLKELSLAGSRVADLSELTDLPRLEILRLEHTAVRDLAPLAVLPRLRTVTVSRDMLPLTWPEDAGYRVILVP